MQVSVESMTPFERRITTHIPFNLFDQLYNEELTQIAKKVKIDGFRPGKVPRHLIEIRFGSQAHADALAKSIQKTLSDALAQEKLNPVNSPVIELKSVEKQQDIEFHAIFEIMPPLETVHFHLDTIEKITAIITDEDVETALKGLREHHNAQDNSGLLNTLHKKDDDLDQLKSDIRTQLEKQLQFILKKKLTYHVLEKLLEQNPIEVPPSLIQACSEQLHNHSHDHAHCDTNAYHHSPEEIQKHQPLAKRIIQLDFLMNYLAKQHDIKLDVERLRNLLLNTANDYESPNNMLQWLSSNKKVLGEFQQKILEEQIIEKLLEDVQIIEKTVSYTELLKMKNE